MLDSFVFLAWEDEYINFLTSTLGGSFLFCHHFDQSHTILNGVCILAMYSTYQPVWNRQFSGTVLRKLYYRGQPKAGTGHKMLFVPFVFSKSRFQGPAFRCDKIVVIVTLLEAIEGIPDEDYNFWENENFHNLYERLLHETTSWAKT